MYKLYSGTMWNTIPGLPRYEISVAGQIRRSGTSRVLVDHAVNGYRRIILPTPEGRRGFLVHRLVALAFLPYPAAVQTQVDHIDGDKTNNAPSNLRWVTAGENQRSNQARLRATGHQNANVKVPTSEIPAIRARHAQGESCVALAAAYGVTRLGMRYILLHRKI